MGIYFCSGIQWANELAAPEQDRLSSIIPHSAMLFARLTLPAADRLNTMRASPQSFFPAQWPAAERPPTPTSVKSRQNVTEKHDSTKFPKNKACQMSPVCYIPRSFEIFMAVKIRMKRVGTKNTPVYRIVVADGRSPRDGKCIEEIGTYQPLKQGDNFTLKLDRATYWISQGAQPSDTVASFIKKATKAVPAAV
jgi:small subunit ribosomal protein S16